MVYKTILEPRFSPPLTTDGASQIQCCSFYGKTFQAGDRIVFVAIRMLDDISIFSIADTEQDRFFADFELEDETTHPRFMGVFKSRCAK